MHIYIYIYIAMLYQKQSAKPTMRAHVLVRISCNYLCFWAAFKGASS